MRSAARVYLQLRLRKHHPSLLIFVLPPQTDVRCNDACRRLLWSASALLAAQQQWLFCFLRHPSLPSQVRGERYCSVDLRTTADKLLHHSCHTSAGWKSKFARETMRVRRPSCSFWKRQRYKEYLRGPCRRDPQQHLARRASCASLLLLPALPYGLKALP